MSATLIAHSGGIIRSRAELLDLPTPAATDTWKPVPHHALVEHLLGGLAAAPGVRVTREQYCTKGRANALFFGAIDLQIEGLESPDFAMALGVRASNDKSLAISLVAAAHVFVCDNMAFSGTGGVVLHRKHTAGLDLGAEVPPAIEQFLEQAGQFRLDLDKMRDFDVAPGMAKELIYDAFAAEVLPQRLFPDVHRLYFRDDVQAEQHGRGTLWSLNNALTEAVKALPPAHQHMRGRLIGRFFHRLLRPSAAVQAN